MPVRTCSTVACSSLDGHEPQLKDRPPSADATSVLPAAPLPATSTSSTSLDAMISLNLRTLRMRRGWRQQDLAVAAGWSRAIVTAVEAGEKRLTLRDAAVLCRVLRVPLSAIVDGADEAEALGLPAAPQPPG